MGESPSSGMSESLHILAQFAAIDAARTFTGAQAQAAGLSEMQVYHCQLAVDEACTNIIEHGYGPDADAPGIDITCRREAERFLIIISDAGPAFDPLAYLPSDDSALRGGWGIPLIRRLMDEMHYERREGRNWLKLVKVVGGPDQMLPVHVLTLAEHLRAVQPQGALTRSRGRMLAVVVDALLAEGVRYLILDLAEVEAVSDAAWQILVGAGERAHQARAALVLTNMRPSIREMLELRGLDLVFMTAPTNEAAITRLQYRADS